MINLHTDFWSQGLCGIQHFKSEIGSELAFYKTITTTHLIIIISNFIP